MEDAAFLDDEGLRRDVAVDAAAAGEVRLALHDEVALELAGHAHVLRADVGLDLALRRQGHVAVGVDLALDLTVDAQVAGRDDVALEARAGADDRDLTVVLSHVASLALVLVRPRSRVSLGGAVRGDRVRVVVVTPEDHRASTGSASAVIACRIASASSLDRLKVLARSMTGFA